MMAFFRALFAVMFIGYFPVECFCFPISRTPSTCNALPRHAIFLKNTEPPSPGEKMRRIYAKEGCPHSSKVLAFMAEANLLHDYSLEYDTQENREMIKDRYNGKVMFPACEFGDEKLMIESNDIIKALADEHEIDPNTLVAFQFIFGWPESKRHTMYKTYMKLIKYGTEKEGSLDQLMIHLAALP